MTQHHLEQPPDDELTPETLRLIADALPLEADGPAEENASTVGRTWRPVDLSAVLDGSYRPPQPTVGARDDGRGIYYPGRAHVLAAESEAGKTWLQLAVHAHEMEAGNGTVYLDFEDNEAGVVGRLLAMSVPADVISKHFAYIRPEEPLTAAGRVELAQALGDLRPTLVTLDGVTEAMTLHGLDPLNNRDVAKFGQTLMKPLASTGPAVVSLDHVVKDKDNRGRYPIGAVHKLNGLNGAMYSLENRERFGVGITGRSGIYVSKDRPGQLRRRCLPSGGRDWFGDLVMASHHEQFAEISIEPPGKQIPQDAGARPIDVMRKISDLLAGERSGFSKAAIEGAIGGRREKVRLALERLTSEGYVREERKGQAIRHHLTRRFEE